MARWKAWLLCGPVGILAFIGLGRVYEWLEQWTRHEHGLRLVSAIGLVGGGVLILVILKVTYEAVSFYEHGGEDALRRDLWDNRRDDDT